MWLRTGGIVEEEWEVPASSGFSDKILEISCDCMHMCGYASV